MRDKRTVMMNMPSDHKINLGYPGVRTAAARPNGSRDNWSVDVQTNNTRAWPIVLLGPP